MSYKGLNDEKVIEIAIDFIKHGQKLPDELKLRIQDMGMIDILNPVGVADDSIF